MFVVFLLPAARSTRCLWEGAGRVPHGSLSGPGLLDGAVPELIHVVRVRAELDAVVRNFRQSSF